MKNIFFNIFGSLFLISYKIVRIFIKEEYVIIAGFKARFLTGNNQYLLDYLCSIETSFNYYFYTKDKKTYEKLKVKYDDKVLYAYSFNTVIKLFKARVLVITSGDDNFSPYPLLENKSVINIWHGIPIKKVGYPSKEEDIKKFERFTNSLNYFCVSADFDGDIIKKAFRLPSEKIFISGLCKNDFIKLNQKSILNKYPYLKQKVILYAPTYRDDNIIQPSFNNIFPIERMHKMLERYDAYFLIRSHFNTEEQNAFEGYERFISASARKFLDPQPLLYYSDMLITDYSGIYFDYLLMDRPIIFYNYDYDDYKVKRDFLYNYEENTPGPKVQTQEDLLIAIEEYLINPEKDAEFRAKIKNRFHKYTDGKACERTYNLIKELM